MTSDKTSGTTSGERTDLVTSEGVDEGSAASTVEGPGSGAGGSDDVVASTRPGGRDHPKPPRGPEGPLDVETADVTAARASAPGQELAAGEGGGH